MSETTGATQNRSRLSLGVTIGVLAALVVAFFIFASLYTEVLWFDQLGFVDVLLTQWFATAAMFVVGFLAMAIPVGIAIDLAYRFRPVYARLSNELDRYRQLIDPLRRLAMLGVPALLGVFAGLAAGSSWPQFLLWMNRAPFGTQDPEFGQDIGFYVFELPVYLSVIGFASAVLITAIIASAATGFLYGAISLDGRELRISRIMRIQLATLGVLYFVVQTLGIWLQQYETLVSPSGGFLPFGAGFAEANATIPSRAILAGIALLVAVLFLVTAIVGRWRPAIVGTALFVVSSLLIAQAYPFVVQRFQVDPSARTLEAPFIDRNIDATRDAYGVNDLVEIPYDAVTETSEGALRQDAETTANIRIIDPALVTDSFAQLEQFRQYYQFPEYLDVGRYDIDGETTDTVLAVREMNLGGLSSQSWYNNTIVYTHGYGLVAAYGNQRTTDGQPKFIESGIPVDGNLGEYQPRIYFGETTPEYSIVGAPEGAPELELDFPSGGEGEANNQTYTYTADGGPSVGTTFGRLLYALKFQSEQILLSDAINDESQILYDRSPRDRVQKVAPYLTLDNDPYPAIVDGRVVWIVDGFTTSADYPYSTPLQISEAIADTYRPAPQLAFDTVNYVRNSVKATVDAYSGEVTLYAWDTEDPLLQAWSDVFPNTLRDQGEMTESLLEHVRYPSDLFKIQRSILGAYHVTDAGTFYSSEDEWVTPNDPISNPAAPTLQPPYYLTMQVPGSEDPAFSLYSTYIPRAVGESTRNVIFGYLAANADPGEDYGKLTLLRLPKQTTIPGPGQVQAQFDSDAEVGQQLNLLRQGQTEVISGNLLTLPVGGGLLYVQPVYVQSTGETSYPLLRKVLVAFGDRLAFEDTLDEALDALFEGDSGVEAGDVEAVVEAETADGTDEAQEPTPAPDTTEPDAGSEEGADEATEEEAPGTVIEESLEAALEDARQALQDRDAAYRDNDLVAAAEADQRLTEALQRALLLSP
ncbi:UPF0182 family protein [Pontimonas sp.]|uniref:UPF0182 family membrane protein n=1 Tax=Pontimonas sp. TaxID=2304492 RepID=UPI0028700656|nr:UPF0182 family protein [Pontimonas sp.]MDR9397191.1 UPF0182 family protein [Pontimonas sp.]